jgi:glycosyltransferase involved in cell wall biosynthesis
VHGETTDRLECSGALGNIRPLVLFGYDDIFGQERGILEVASAIASRGACPSFLISRRWGDRANEELQKRGFPVESAPYGYQITRFRIPQELHLPFINLYGLIATSARLGSVVEQKESTHILAGNSTQCLYGMGYLMRSNIPLIFRLGDAPPSNPIDRLIWHWCMRRANKIICNCEYLFRLVSKWAGYKAKCQVIYNYASPRAQSTQPIPVPAGNTVVTYVGQLSKLKGADIFVRAAIRLSKGRPKICFLIVGGSNMTLTFEQTVREMTEGHDRIVFLGYRDDVDRILEITDIHVAPSVYQDPSPNVVVEAKRAGVPSVVFPNGGLPELVRHGIDGYICTESSVEALIQGISWFLDSPERRIDAGRRAREDFEDRFGYKRFVNGWARVFNDIQSVNA